MGYSFGCSDAAEHVDHDDGVRNGKYLR